MPRLKPRRVEPREERPAFDAETFLRFAGATRRIATYSKGKVVFSQGQPSDAVMYIQKGGIKISVVSRTGKEAVVAMLGPGDFFGEGALTGQSIRIGTASATTLTTVLVLEKEGTRGSPRAERSFSATAHPPQRTPPRRSPRQLQRKAIGAGVVAARALRRSSGIGAADTEDLP